VIAIQFVFEFPPNPSPRSRRRSTVSAPGGHRAIAFMLGQRPDKRCLWRQGSRNAGLRRVRYRVQSSLSSASMVVSFGF